MEEELQDFSTLLEEGGDNNTTFPLIISNVNTSTLCFVISRYSQLFLHTDLEQSLTTRMLDPEILHRIQTQLKRYCTIFKKEETTVHLNILFYKLGERNKDVEDLILYRFRQASVNKLISQYNEVRWLVFYGTFFLVISTFLMFGAGYASEFWAEDNEGTVSHSLLVLIILICTFGFQVFLLFFFRFSKCLIIGKQDYYVVGELASFGFLVLCHV